MQEEHQTEPAAEIAVPTRSTSEAHEELYGAAAFEAPAETKPEAKTDNGDGWEDDAPATDEKPVDTAEDGDGWEDSDQTPEPAPAKKDDDLDAPLIPRRRLNEVREQGRKAAEDAYERGRREAMQDRPGRTPEVNGQEFTQADVEAYVTEHDPEAKALAAAVAKIEASPDSYDTAAAFSIAHNRALAALNRAVEAKAGAIISHTQAEQSATQATEAQHISGLVTNFEAKIAASEIPNAKKYADRLVANAAAIHPEIRRAILEHPTPDIAAAALVANKTDFDWFADQSKKHAGRMPVAAISRLGELISDFKRTSTPTAKRAEAERKAATLPKAPRGTSGGSSHEGMDPFAYARAVQTGKVKGLYD